MYENVTRKTDQEVPVSGIYRVIHAEHRLPDEVALIAGNRFPRCGRCSKPVSFELLKSAPYLASRASVVVHEISSRDRQLDTPKAA